MMTNVIKLCFSMVLALFIAHSSVSFCHDEVAKNIIDLYHNSFLSYFDERSSDIWKLQWIPFDRVAKKAVKIDKGYDGFSYECIKSTYPSFKRFADRTYLKKIMAKLSDYIDCINKIVTRYRTEKSADVNSLFRITHEEAIKQASLPAHIDKQELFTNHVKCRQVVHYLTEEEQDVIVLAGLFAKYWVEEVRK